MGVRAGGGGGAAAPPISEIVNFFGQNAHNAGNSTWEKTSKHQKKRNETATVIPKRQAKYEHANFWTSKGGVWSHEVSSTREPI